jgi:ATP-dependent exoDNAse (exonuclease V) alpha subunit
MHKFPLRHLSVRVPWHDSGWSGLVCKAPQLNGACVKLKGIANSKNDAKECEIAGKSLNDLAVDELPPCVNERGSFMAPFELEPTKRHALAHMNPDDYGHFQPTPQRYPAYSAGIVPFRWLMRANLENLARDLAVDASLDREPELKYESLWVHEAGNQTALLDGFAGHLREEDSLCLFYAKHVPFVEGTARVLIGAGRIKKIGKLSEYKRNAEGPRGMLWERPVQHSIRPNGEDGFLMPYTELLAKAEADPSLDLERYTAKAPDEHWNEFSYASELVRHDGAIASLLAMDLVLGRMHEELGIELNSPRKWIHTELVRLWKVRGPFPGLGAVLTAFGLSRGVFVAHALQERAGANVDPWPQVDTAFKKPDEILPEPLHADIKALASTWKDLPAERREYQKLLSRFELSVEQAQNLYEEGLRKKAGWGGTDKEILENPYRIYELSRHDPDGIRLLTVDRGVFPDDAVRLVHPLEAPSCLVSGVDRRRVRAFCLDALEKTALDGHTLQSRDGLVEAIRAFAVKPECAVTGDVLRAQLPQMAPEIVPALLDGDEGLQLDRYKKIGELVRKELKRVDGARHVAAVDWNQAVLEKLKKPVDEEDKRAHAEKAAALKELAEARLSILAGPAGAGKTTVLGILCAQAAITNEAILLLAPTGKARVRMQELTKGATAQAMTVAQFLNQHGRYDGKAGRYILSDRPKAEGYGTVIVDESSMLTEDMLGALFDALKGVKRFIFVGDPAQLPPIGAGRPFVDLIAKLRPENREAIFPRVGKSYAELTIERRQVGEDRPDLRFARWFSATAPDAGDDDIFCDNASVSDKLHFVQWTDANDFQVKLLEVLCDELELSSADDLLGFNKSLGSFTSEKGNEYFDRTKNDKPGSVEAVEAWQILSPLRGMSFGVSDINRQIHERFRKGFLELAASRYRFIPKPMGAERVVYGDKVINLSNHTRGGRKVFPQEGALGYLANGEIGLAVGQWKSGSKILKVEFASQKGYTYDFYGSDFKDEGAAAMELAYALTIHKAQGSQFGLTIVVLPEGHPILSRELIYTALTRHQHRVVILHQGARSRLKDFASPFFSSTARRMTNLLSDCRMREVKQEKGSIFLQDGLIHLTSDGRAVRSMSELVIAEALIAAGQDFSYERRLELGGEVRYPDFTIDDEISGRTIYWEHLGMLEKKGYREKWKKKLAWYIKNGVKPESDGGGPNGMLVTSEGSGSTAFNAAEIQATIKRLF